MAGTSPAIRRLGFRKRIVFILGVMVVADVLLEVFAFTVFWVRDRRPFSFANGSAHRRTVIAEYEQYIADDPATRGRIAGWLRQEVVHPYVGYVTRPGGNDEVSAHGYLDSREPILKRQPYQVILAVVGGSLAMEFVQGPGDETLIEQLGQLPAFHDKQFVCLNLAMGGYKQPQQWMTISYLMALGAEFDIVINIDGFNDVALHEVENQPKDVAPAFPRNWYARVGLIPDPTLQRLAGQRTMIEWQRAQFAQRFSGRPWRYSITCQLIWRLINGALIRRSWQATRAFVDYEPAGETAYVITGPGDPFGDDDPARYAYLADLWARCSRLLHGACRAHGARYYHFLQPNQYVEGSKPLSDEERELAHDESFVYRAGAVKGYPLLIEAGRQLVADGVAFTDLTRVFAGRTQTLYRDTCCHVNDEGNRLIAEAMARTIAADIQSRNVPPIP